MADFVHIYEPGEPTLVMLHGTGGDERDMAAFGRSLLPGAGILAPRGKEPEHGMNRYFRRHAEGVLDLQNLSMRADELADFVVATAPEGRRVAIGFSNGANVATTILWRRPEVFQAALLLAPMLPYEPREVPDLMGVRIHLDCGENDPIVPRESAAHLAALLSKAGARVSVRWHPGGHTLDAEGVAAAREVLREM